jgi:hypothetical protein
MFPVRMTDPAKEHAAELPPPESFGLSAEAAATHSDRVWKHRLQVEKSRRRIAWLMPTAIFGILVVAQNFKKYDPASWFYLFLVFAGSFGLSRLIRVKREKITLPAELVAEAAKVDAWWAARNAKLQLLIAEKEKRLAAEKAEAEKVAAVERARRQVQRDYWLNIDGIEFENRVAALLNDLGYDAKTTARTSDGGIDVLALKDGKKIVVQCKAHSKRIAIATVKELHSTRIVNGADEAWLVCWEGATAPAAEFCKAQGIKILTVSDLVGLRASTKNGGT